MEDDQLSKQESLRILAAYIASRVERGETAEAVRADLIARGLKPETASYLVSRFAPRRWTLGGWGRAAQAVGSTILFAGCGLALGNRFGFFPTFPLAGTLTILLGGAIFTLAGGKLYGSSEPGQAPVSTSDPSRSAEPAPAPDRGNPSAVDEATFPDGPGR